MESTMPCLEAFQHVMRQRTVSVKPLKDLVLVLAIHAANLPFRSDGLIYAATCQEDQPWFGVVFGVGKDAEKCVKQGDVVQLSREGGDNVIWFNRPMGKVSQAAGEKYLIDCPEIGIKLEANPDDRWVATRPIDIIMKIGNIHNDRESFYYPIPVSRRILVRIDPLITSKGGIDLVLDDPMAEYTGIVLEVADDVDDDEIVQGDRVILSRDWVGSRYSHDGVNYCMVALDYKRIQESDAVVKEYMGSVLCTMPQSQE